MLPIAQELGWAPGVQGVVQSAFLWGYLATQLLGGTLADNYGGGPAAATLCCAHQRAHRENRGPGASRALPAALPRLCWAFLLTGRRPAWRDTAGSMHTL